MSSRAKVIQLDQARKSNAAVSNSTLIPLPIGMSIDEAQAYTGFSRKHLDELTKSGKLTRRRLGPKGAFIVQRRQLEEVLEEAFEEHSDCLSGDFRFA